MNPIINEEAVADLLQRLSIEDKLFLIECLKKLQSEDVN